MHTTVWTLESVHELVALARGGASADVISLRLKKPISAVRAKLAELGLAPREAA